MAVCLLCSLVYRFPSPSPHPLPPLQILNHLLPQSLTPSMRRTWPTCTRQGLCWYPTSPQSPATSHHSSSTAMLKDSSYLLSKCSNVAKILSIHCVRCLLLKSLYCFRCLCLSQCALRLCFDSLTTGVCWTDHLSVQHHQTCGPDRESVEQQTILVCWKSLYHPKLN